MAASIAIAIVVGISTYFSPKKSAILVGSIVGFFVLFRILYQIWFLGIPASIPGIMHPVNLTERVIQTLVRSPLWFYIYAAAIFSVIAWFGVVLRKKIMGLLP
jgi:hypothetical protein